MRYVVTGAAGFIGSHLAESLIAGGHEVVGLDCLTDYYAPALKEENARGLDVQRLDLAEDELDFSGFDAVFHLAGQPGARSFGDVFPLYLRRNVLATQRVFEAAVAAGLKVVWASSSSVYGDAERYPTPEDAALRPNNPYGITKLACEQLHDTYARVFGLRAVALRYFTVYGPRQRPDMAFARIVAALAAGEPFELYGDGSQSRSFTYIADVVAATVLALEAAPGVYNVGGGEEATMRQALALLEEIAGRTLEVTFGPSQTGDMRRTKADTRRIEQRARLACRHAAPRRSRGALALGLRYPHDPMSPAADEEREVDLARWRRAVVAFWWLPVAGLVAGAILGILYSFSGGTSYKATALISLGQPTSPGGALVTGFGSNPRAISLIVSSADAQERAANTAGMQRRARSATTSRSRRSGR